MSEDLYHLTLEELSSLIHAGDLSPRVLTESYLERIEQVNGDLNLFLTVLQDEALVAARESEEALARGEDHGPLHGIPVAVKDNMDIAGQVTTAGTAALRDNHAKQDAEVVQRLRTAGAILIGKTNLHEWALGATSINPYFGAVRNPWNPNYSPSGSSGGSAGAVAAGCCAAAMGTDTGGSIRLPAAVCNLTGLRPPYGWIPTDGALSVSWSLDVVGPIARTARDCALILHALADRPSAAPAPESDSLERIRIAIAENEEIWSLTDPEIAGLVRDAAGQMAILGATLESLTLVGFKEASRAAGVISLCETVAYHRARLESHPEDFSDEIRTMLERGLKHTAAELAEAQEVERAWRSHLLGLFKSGIDAIALPTSPVYPPRIDDPDPETIKYLLRLTFPFGLGGLPSMSVPCGFGANGLPVGIQLVGRDTDALLHIASAYQQATHWHLTTPSF